jgi:cell division protein FtsQ
MDADTFPREVLAEEEPKYLRRQKPLEIKRRKFGRTAWSTYLRVGLWGAAGVAGASVAYALAHFLLFSPDMALLHPEQVELGGNHNVTRASVLEVFKVDRGRSILRVPLEERRRQLEATPWVENATVRRALPNRIEIEIVERTPVAFLRQGNEMSLVDLHGVILERPLKGNFHFPVVSGLGPEMPLEERERRMQLFASFSRELESARGGAMDKVSEVDLSDANDLRASIASLPGGRSTGAAGAQQDAPILVHFGSSDFGGKYQTLLENIGQYRATAGCVESVDLRFSRMAVVNPDATGCSQPLAQQRAANSPAGRAAKKGR